MSEHQEGNEPTAEGWSDEALDQLLAGGQPGGPALDAVWARVKADLHDRPSPAEQGLLQRWGARFGVLFAGLAAAAAVVFAVALPSDRGLQARGGEQGAPVLEATCGSTTQPCPVGEALFLRLHGAERAFRVDLALVTRQGAVPLLSRLPIAADQTFAVPRKIRPEVSDIDNGVIVEVRATPAEGGDPVIYRLTLQVRE
jgi:hypothetical protein